MIKRNPLLNDESRMLVHVQDTIDRWKIEILDEMIKKKNFKPDMDHIDHMVRKEIKSTSEFEKLYMHKSGSSRDFTKDEDDE